MKFLNLFILILFLDIFHSFGLMNFKNKIQRDPLKSLIILIIGGAIGGCGGTLITKKFKNKGINNEINNLKKSIVEIFSLFEPLQKNNNENQIVEYKEELKAQIVNKIKDLKIQVDKISGNIKEKELELEKQKNLSIEQQKNNQNLEEKSLAILNEKQQHEEKLLKIQKENVALEIELKNNKKQFENSKKELNEPINFLKEANQKELTKPIPCEYLSGLYGKVSPEIASLTEEIKKLKEENEKLIFKMEKQAEDLNKASQDVIEKNVQQQKEIAFLSQKSQYSQQNEVGFNEKIKIPADKGDQSVTIEMLKKENEELMEKIKSLSKKFESEIKYLFNLVEMYQNNFYKTKDILKKKLNILKAKDFNNAKIFTQEDENPKKESFENLRNDSEGEEGELDQNHKENLFSDKELQEKIMYQNLQKVESFLDSIEEEMKKISGYDEDKKKSIFDLLKKNKEEEAMAKLKKENFDLNQKIKVVSEELNKKIQELSSNQMHKDNINLNNQIKLFQQKLI